MQVTSSVCKESRAPDPQIGERATEAETLHGTWSSCCTFFSAGKVFQEKRISTETHITSQGGNSKLFSQPLRIPLGTGRAVTACDGDGHRPRSSSLPPTRQPHLLIHGAGVVTPPSTPPAPSEGSDIIPILRRSCVNCGKEDRERERAMLSEMQESRKTLRQQARQHKPPPSCHRDAGGTGSFAAAVRACPQAPGSPWVQPMASGGVPGAGPGKAQGRWCLLWHVLNGQGVGNWLGHKRGTQRGPPRGQKSQTVPEEQRLFLSQAFSAVNSL